MKTDEGVRKFEALANDIADLVLEFGGALSGEHGDGLVRSPFMQKMFGPMLYEAFRSIKRTFDPDGIFNPGKIVDAPPLTPNLRYGAGYQTPRPVTFFDYAEYGGMAGAVEMCSGLGACRKKLDGTMCPSYMATREEAHSTRGRANVLRLAMAGRLGESGLGDEGVQEVLDLCLECRACKAECPVGVDVARFKSEFLADYWTRHGTPLRARVSSDTSTTCRDGAAALAPVSNVLARSAPVRWINERILGLDRRRKPPAWASTTFTERCSRELGARTGSHPRRALQAPRPIFQRHVHQLLQSGCRHGRREASRAGRLQAGAGARTAAAGGRSSHKVCWRRPERWPRGTPPRSFRSPSRAQRIVFFEPSCLSAIREDAPSLLRGEAQQRASVGRRRVHVLRGVSRETTGRRRSTCAHGPATILLHGHCHQKAMGLLAPAKALLSRIPGATVVDLNAGCCGMAGSFGYVRDHFDVSRAIGERRLLPAGATPKADSVLVASGVSCRHQVEDFTDARALHPAELLRSLW